MKKLSIILAGAALVATASFSQAQPITLETSGPTTLKFNNFENLINNAGNPTTIVAGDQFQGVFLVSSIGTVLNPNQLSGQLGTTDMYGTFSLTVASGSTSIIPGSSGALVFTMNAGDYIKIDTAAAGTFASILASSATGSAAITALNTAGTPWAQVTGADYVQGVSQSTNGSNSTSNYNWVNFDSTNNNIGYVITPQSFGPYDGITNIVDMYLQDIVALNNPTLTGVPTTEFTYSSTDPAILYASAVPEPGTFALVGFGLMGLGYFARRRNQK